MGERVLNVTVPGYPSALTRVYAHCARGGPAGAVAVLALNYDGKGGLDVHLPFPTLPRLEYVLSAPDLRSPSIMLNGDVLRPGSGGTISVPDGRKVASGSSLLHLPARTYGFFVLPDAGVAACQ